MANITKDVTLSMVAYSATPTFTTSDVLSDMQSFPDIMGSPSALDCTTLADSYRHYIAGIKDNSGSLEFGFLYSKTLMNTLNGAVGVHKSFQLKFPDGVTLTFAGYINPAIDGHGVDEVLTLRAVIMMDSDITIGGLA